MNGKLCVINAKLDFSVIDTVNRVNTLFLRLRMFIYSLFKYFLNENQFVVYDLYMYSKDTERINHEQDKQNPYNFMMKT